MLRRFRLEEPESVAEVSELLGRFGDSAKIYAGGTELLLAMKEGLVRYERLINVVHDAAISAGKRLCGPWAWRDRPDFTCFQNQSETAAIAAGVRQELGKDINTQGRVTVGPYAQPTK